MNLVLSSKAGRQLRKLKNNRELLDRLRNALTVILENPQIGKQLVGDLHGILSHRVGDWRILYEVYEDELLILVINIADRKDVYR